MSQLPLILGGHSFIRQLGNEPKPNLDNQIAIVETCLDNGICWFDTTYQPERVALGNILRELNRRREAVLIGWNFFSDFDEEGEVGGAGYYQPHHIELMLEQFQTDIIDCLVVHPLSAEIENQRQEELCRRWQQQGYVKKLGTWAPPANVTERFSTGNPYTFMVSPLNVTTADSGRVFTACRKLGWENYACSPFVRGWELDRLVECALRRYGGEPAGAREKVADLMLRYSLFSQDVDKLIVAIRRVEWIGKNIASYRKGKPDDSELSWLKSLYALET